MFLQMSFVIFVCVHLLALLGGEDCIVISGVLTVESVGSQEAR